MNFYPREDLPLEDHIWMDETDDLGPADLDPSRRVLGANITRLMQARQNLNSNPKLSKRAGIGIATISRIINGETAATLDTLTRLAEAFGVQSWQLLVPNLDPKSPQILRSSSPQEAELYERLRKVIAEEAAVQSQGSDSGYQDLSAGGPTGAGSYRKITPVPSTDQEEASRHKKER